MKKMICCFGLLFMVLGGERNNLDAQLAGDHQGQGIERSAGQQRNIPGGRSMVTGVVQDDSLQKKVQDLIALVNNPSQKAYLIKGYAFLDIVEIGQPAVEPLIDALKHENKDVRILAVAALGRINDARAVKPLLNALKDEDQVVRRAVPYALGEIDNPDAIPFFIDAMKDENQEIVQSSVRALGRLGDARAVQPLIKALEDKDIRAVAAYALGELGDARAVQPLVKALEDEHEGFRRTAARALGSLGDARVFPLLIKDLEHENKIFRASAARVLGNLGDARAVQPLIKALEDKEICLSAIRALGKVGDARAVKPLLNALKDESRTVRESARDALAQIDDPKALQLLADAMKHEDQNVRVGVTFALGKKGDIRAVKHLIDVMKGEDKNLIGMAMFALNQIGDSLDPTDTVLSRKTVPVLIQELDSTNPQVRQASVFLLGKMGDTRAVKPLLKLMKDKNKGFSDSVVTLALIEIGKPAVPTLIDLLADKDNETSLYAAGALGRIGDTRAVEPLIKTMERHAKEKSRYLGGVGALAQIGDAHSVCALKDLAEDESTSYTIRRYLLMALVRTDNPQAASALINALKDENQNVRRSAISDIGGSDFEMKRTYVAHAVADDPQVVQLLINTLQDKTLRRNAVQALGVLGNAQAVEPLLKILKVDQQDWMIYNPTARAVASIGTAQGVQVLIDNVEAGRNTRPKSEVYNASLTGLGLVTNPEAIPALINGLESKGTEQLHRDMEKALIIIGKPAVPPLLDALKDKDRSSPEATRILNALRSVGVRMIGIGEDAQIWPEMINTPRTEKVQEKVTLLVSQLSATYDRRMGNRNVAEIPRRRYSSEALIKIGKPAVQPLINLLNTPDGKEDVKTPPVQPLIYIPEDQQYRKRDITTRFLQNNGGGFGPYDLGLRAIVARCLGEIGDAKAVQPLAKLLDKDEEISTRCMSARALGKIGDSSAVEVLAKILINDDDNRLRGIAARSLGQIGNARAVRYLIDALDDKDAGVRIDSAWALGEIGDAQAVKPLKNALTDSVIYVRSAAKESLQKIVP